MFISYRDIDDNIDDNIDDVAFLRNQNLTSISIPNSVTTIGDRAFQKCTNLTSVDMGDSVTSIEHQAFSFCSSLTSITFNGTTAQWKTIPNEDNWNYNTGNYTIYCTDGTIAKDGTVTYN